MTFRIALIQIAGISSDKSANLAIATRNIASAALDGSKKTNLVVLPECFNSPYGVKHFPKFAEVIGFKRGRPYDTSSSSSESVRAISAAAKSIDAWVVGGSIPEKCSETGKLFNTSIVFNPSGDLVATHRKTHLFDIDIPGKITFKESETLSAGSEMTQFETPFGKFGLGICYDIRFPEVAQIAARQGCDMMIYPGAFNTTTGPLHWELLARARAVDNQMYVAVCSPARDMEAEYHAWGHSSVVAPDGQIVATTDEKEAIVYAEIDLEAIKSIRSGIPITTQRRSDVYTLSEAV